MPYTVLLVDDHKILRDGIKAILERTAEFHVVGENQSRSGAHGYWIAGNERH